MTEQLSNRQLFFEESKSSIEQIRHSLFVQTPTQGQFVTSVEAVNVLNKAAVGIELDSFRAITGCLENVLLQHSVAQTIPGEIELEVLRLAVDWLAQLAILYSKDLPEPKPLIAELLYAFELIDHSLDAASLAELVTGQTEQGTSNNNDPFLEDPEFTVEKCSTSREQDPFVDDPGFDLAFDLLQRTLNLSPETRERISDPFSDDPSFIATTTEIQPLLDDPFDDDPLLPDDLDPQK